MKGHFAVLTFFLLASAVWPRIRQQPTTLVFSLPQKQVFISFIKLPDPGTLYIDLAAVPRKITMVDVMDIYRCCYAVTLGYTDMKQAMILAGAYVKNSGVYPAGSYLGLTEAGELKFFEALRLSRRKQALDFAAKNRLRHLLPTGHALVQNGKAVSHYYLKGRSEHLLDSVAPRMVLAKTARGEWHLLAFVRKNRYAAGVTFGEMIFILSRMKYLFAFHLYSGENGMIGYRNERTDARRGKDTFKSFIPAVETRESDGIPAPSGKEKYFLIWARKKPTHQ